jgi:DNA-directed RNA polymerase specialized sigma24 family protein
MTATGPTASACRHPNRPYLEAMTTSENDVCARIRAGDPSALLELLERDHPATLFLARALVGDHLAEAVVAKAWEDVIAAIASGRVTGALRAAAMSSVMAAHRVDDLMEQLGVRMPLGTFAPPGDRWEGWWDNEPPPWPQGAIPQPDQVLRAVRRLPTKQRTVLVLRDVARLSLTEVALIIGSPTALDSLLNAAREAYIIELDREMSGM